MKVLRLSFTQQSGSVKKRCCYSYCNKKLYHGTQKSNRKSPYHAKGFRVGTLKSQKMGAYWCIGRTKLFALQRAQ